MITLLQSQVAALLAQGAIKVFDPQSPEARAIFHLAIVAGIIFAVIFAIVAGMIVYALMRYRWREGEADPRQLAGNKTVEIVWTVIPCLIVVALFLLTWQTMGASDPARAGDAGHRDHRSPMVVGGALSEIRRDHSQ